MALGNPSRPHEDDTWGHLGREDFFGSIRVSSYLDVIQTLAGEFDDYLILMLEPSCTKTLY
jgi:hypothetical protein